MSIGPKLAIPKVAMAPCAADDWWKNAAIAGKHSAGVCVGMGLRR